MNKEAAEIVDVARSQGWTAIENARHYKLVPPGGLTADQPRPLTVAKTPSDYRWRANVYADIKRRGEAGEKLVATLKGAAPSKADSNGQGEQWLEPGLPRPVHVCRALGPCLRVGADPRSNKCGNKPHRYDQDERDAYGETRG